MDDKVLDLLQTLKWFSQVWGKVWKYATTWKYVEIVDAEWIWKYIAEKVLKPHNNCIRKKNKNIK